MLRYPVSLTTEDGQEFRGSETPDATAGSRVLVDFLDLPAHTYGDDEAEALARAVDALTTMIGAYMRHRQPIPAPSEPRHGGATVPLPPLLVAKVELYNTMLAQQVNKAELGRRLHWHLPQVDRVLDVRHASRLDQLEQALAAVGKRLELHVVEERARVRREIGGSPRRRPPVT